MEAFSALVLTSLSLLQFILGTNATTLTIVNSCNDIIWPVVLPNPGSPPLSPSGFPLNPGDREILPVPSGWSGHLWARTHCATSVADAKFSCTTGDCGSSAVDCGSSGGGILSPPATVAEFTINTPPFPDTYSLSVVYGYNLPVTVVPTWPGGSCATVGCSVDFASANSAAELRVSYGGGNEIVGLKSACEAFGEAEYCCSNSNGSYSSSKITCKQNSYSELFKNWCPHARTFANDNTGTTFTCEAEDYVVNFCAPPTRTSGNYNPTGGTGSTLPGARPASRARPASKSLSDNAKLAISITISVTINLTISVYVTWNLHSKHKSKITGLKLETTSLKKEFTSLKSEVTSLKSEVTSLKSQVTILKIEVTSTPCKCCF